VGKEKGVEMWCALDCRVLRPFDGVSRTFSLGCVMSAPVSDDLNGVERETRLRRVDVPLPRLSRDSRCSDPTVGDVLLRRVVWHTMICSQLDCDDDDDDGV
jgi:hypothetical protein